MIFTELHSAYYAAVAELISIALTRPVTREDIARAAEKHGFLESALNIEKALSEERWQVITKNGETPLRRVPETPPTLLQKRFLKAVLLDPRAKLFDLDIPELEGVDPLFTSEDFEIFDCYGDGDPYDDPGYIGRFRLILSALKENKPLELRVRSRKDAVYRLVTKPVRLEYSEKDDKFRLYAVGARHTDVITLQRIVSARLFEGEFTEHMPEPRQSRSVTFILTDRRKALERVLLHFAHLEKQTERIDGLHYRVTLTYDEDDETEMVIRLLSFGPMIMVTEPESFVELIKKRLLDQKNCGL